jgi:Phage QLRG family, putative DNA packaging.
MEEYKYLEDVKNALGIEGSYQDKTLKQLINEVIEDLIDSGVKKEVAVSKKAVGTIAIGINDIWNYSAGEVKHSPYFEKRCIKLAYEKVGTENV